MITLSRFHTLAADRWNDSTLQDTFFHGLSDAIQNLLVTLKQSPDLDSLIALAIKLFARERELEDVELQLPEAPAPTSHCRDTISVPPRSPLALQRSCLSLSGLGFSQDVTSPVTIKMAHNHIESHSFLLCHAPLSLTERARY